MVSLVVGTVAGHVVDSMVVGNVRLDLCALRVVRRCCVTFVCVCPACECSVKPIWRSIRKVQLAGTNKRVAFTLGSAPLLTTSWAPSHLKARWARIALPEATAGVSGAGGTAGAGARSAPRSASTVAAGAVSSGSGVDGAGGGVVCLQATTATTMS